MKRRDTMRKKTLIITFLLASIVIGSYYVYNFIKVSKIQDDVIDYTNSRNFNQAIKALSQLTTPQIEDIKDEVINRLVVFLKEDYTNMNVSDLGSIQKLSSKFTLDSSDWRNDVIIIIPAMKTVMNVTGSETQTCNTVNEDAINDVNNNATSSFNDLIYYYGYGNASYRNSSYDYIIEIQSIDVKDCDRYYNYLAYKNNVIDYLNSAYYNPSGSNISNQIANWTEELKSLLSYKQYLLSNLNSVLDLSEKVDNVFKSNASKISSLE